MEYNLNIYGVGTRYVLCAICGVIGGLTYISYELIGTLLLFLSVVFFLQGILAFSPLAYIMKKNTAKDAIDDFK